MNGLLIDRPDCIEIIDRLVFVLYTRLEKNLKYSSNQICYYKLYGFVRAETGNDRK